MANKWVLVPFTGKVDKSSTSNYKDAWNDRHAAGIAFGVTATSMGLLAKVGSGDTLYIQAHGYSDTFEKIGGVQGKGAVEAKELVAMILALLPTPRPKRLKIKLFSCFSGFGFAHDVFRLLSPQLPDIAVYGYKGETQVTARGTPKQVVRLPDGTKPDGKLRALLQKLADDGAERNKLVVSASSADVRVVYTSAHPGGRPLGLHADPWA
jgi:hypothetical protein